jgi:hypothetical protein
MNSTLQPAFSISCEPFTQSILCEGLAQRALRERPRPSDLLSLVYPPPKLFKINTSITSHKCSFQRTYRKINLFRMNTYKKQRGGGRTLGMSLTRRAKTAYRSHPMIALMMALTARA